MKYIFVIGNHSDFDSHDFRVFLQHILDLDGGRPFQLFLYKYNQDILNIEYPYLSLSGQEKKYLALYPNLLLRTIDLGTKGNGKQDF